MTLIVRWIDRGVEPKSPPKQPQGIDVDTSNGAAKTCSVALPYPAQRCGFYSIRCDVCGGRDLITTAGRVDDPRSYKRACGAKHDRR